MPIQSLKSGVLSRSTMVGNTLIYPGDFESIATATVGSGGQASVDFTSIPQTFTHLQLRGLSRGTVASGAVEVNMTFNNDSTSSSYIYYHQLFGNGTSVNSNYASKSDATRFTYMTAASATSNMFATNIIDILDYTNTNKNKVCKTLQGFDLNGSSTGFIIFSSHAWLKTNAINRITITPNSGSFAEYTSIALYGVK